MLDTFLIFYFSFFILHLGIDYGTSQIWLAISKVGIAIPFCVLDEASFFEQLPKILTENSIQTIVVGVAIGYDPYGKQYGVFKWFIDRVRKAAPESVEVVEQDEDLSTFEAQESLDKLGSKDHLDDVAASIILQRYLDKGSK